MDVTPYERDVLPFVRPFTEALVRSVDVNHIDGLLDHGSGTGEVVLRLREAGFRGSVDAFDPNETMVARLRSNIGESPNCRILQSNLESFIATDPGRRYGLITSQLVMPFVPDPAREF